MLHSVIFSHRLQKELPPTPKDLEKPFSECFTRQTPGPRLCSLCVGLFLTSAGLLAASCFSIIVACYASAITVITTCPGFCFAVTFDAGWLSR